MRKGQTAATQECYVLFWTNLGSSTPPPKAAVRPLTSHLTNHRRRTRHAEVVIYLAFLLRCSTKPNKWGTQWDSNSHVKFCYLSLQTISPPRHPYLLIFLLRCDTRPYEWDTIWLICLFVFMHINNCRLFNIKSIFIHRNSSISNNSV